VLTFSRRHAVQTGTEVRDEYFWFSRGRQGGFAAATAKKKKSAQRVFFKIPGEHNFENAAAAITVGKYLASQTRLHKGDKKFRGLEHRLDS